MSFECTTEDMVLHWATKTTTSEDPNAWVMAPEALKPPNTSDFGDGIASRTPFVDVESRVSREEGRRERSDGDRGDFDPRRGVVARGRRGRESVDARS